VLAGVGTHAVSFMLHASLLKQHTCKKNNICKMTKNGTYFESICVS
jgi:hypothetical protein